jgi:hypothetical protein
LLLLRLAMPGGGSGRWTFIVVLIRGEVQKGGAVSAKWPS